MGILGSGVRDGLQLKPVRYDWAYRLYNQAVANTWFPNEVQLSQDLADFEKLSEDEKHALKTVISYLNPNELLINKDYHHAGTCIHGKRRYSYADDVPH